MVPIQELLNRIRWDPEFGAGEFVIGYLDRVEQAIILTPFQEVIFTAGDHFAFLVLGDDGICRHIPFHRVRQVFKNGDLIWSR